MWTDSLYNGVWTGNGSPLSYATWLSYFSYFHINTHICADLKHLHVKEFTRKIENYKMALNHFRVLNHGFFSKFFLSHLFVRGGRWWGIYNWRNSPLVPRHISKGKAPVEHNGLSSMLKNYIYSQWIILKNLQEIK